MKQKETQIVSEVVVHEESSWKSSVFRLEFHFTFPNCSNSALKKCPVAQRLIDPFLFPEGDELPGWVDDIEFAVMSNYGYE